MKINLLNTFSMLILAGSMLVGCRSDVDLKDVDATADVSINLPVPVGSLKITTGDFLGMASSQKIYVDTVDGRNLITWKDTFSMNRTFHPVDLKQYLSGNTFSVNIYDKLKEVKYEFPAGSGNMVDLMSMGNTIYLPKGYSHHDSLSFVMPLKLNGINDDQCGERIDSASITNADFGTKINRLNFDYLKWEWIDSVKLDMGEHITPHDGSSRIVTIYSKATSKVNDYGEDLPILLKNFTLDLIKDKTKDVGFNNALDSCSFNAKVFFTIPEQVTVNVPTNASIQYDFSVRFIDFEALWGWFEPSTQMYDEGVFDISRAFDDLAFLKKSRLPFAEPRIMADVATQVAGALVVSGEYLYAEDSYNVKRYAMFTDEDGIESPKFRKRLNKGQYLDPHNSQLTDTAKFELLFDNTPQNGKINQMFIEMPQKIAYKFIFNFDTTQTKQIRVQPNTFVDFHAEAKLPMYFMDSLAINYTDTMSNIGLSSVDIDSLERSTNWLYSLRSTSKVDLVITVENAIPLALRAKFKCLDEKGNVIMKPNSTTEPFTLFNDSVINIACPTSKKEGEEWVIQPTKNLFYGEVTRAGLDSLPKIKTILYTIEADNNAIAKVEPGTRIKPDESLTIGIGLTAQIDAVVKFFNNNNNK